MVAGSCPTRREKQAARRAMWFMVSPSTRGVRVAKGGGVFNQKMREFGHFDKFVGKGIESEVIRR